MQLSWTYTIPIGDKKIHPLLFIQSGYVIQYHTSDSDKRAFSATSASGKSNFITSVMVMHDGAPAHLGLAVKRVLLN